MHLHQLTIKEMQQAMDSGEFNSQELTAACLENIEADNTHEKPVNAFISIYKEKAMQAAERADAERHSGKASPLLGIPLAIKDNLNLAGEGTTCASRILEGYRSVYTATAVEKLQEAGAVILGKTNMDEFAMGSSTETSCFGPTRNPADRNRIPGGSSGGSAAAVAAGFTVAALGSDTGGSIRQPAAHCGVVGLKPTYGLVSRYGLVAFASSLDQIGPLTHNVSDAATLLQAISGHDSRDSTSSREDIPDYSNSLLTSGSLEGSTIGIPREYFRKGMDSEIERLTRKAIAQLKEQGATIEEISLPHTDYAVAMYYIVATAEASSNLARYDGIRYGFRDPEAHDLASVFTGSRAKGFGAEVKRRIMLGTYVLSSGYYDAYYLQALKARTLLKEDFLKAFQKVDAILGPVSPSPAFPLGEKLDDPVAMYLSDIYTIAANLAGIPGISLPAGKTDSGLPVGIQILGSHFQESAILKIASVFEKGQQENSKGP